MSKFDELISAMKAAAPGSRQQLLQYLMHNLERMPKNRLAAEDREALMAGLAEFLPYIDNWATCDMLRPRLFGQDIPALRQSIAGWMADSHPYACRFGIEMLMVHCLKAAFLPDDLAAVSAVGAAREGEYYVAMMCAWYFATALAEQPAAVMPYFFGRRLSPGIWSRAVQKACESLRIPAETKAELRRLRANFC